VVDLNMLVPVIPRCEHGFTELAGIARYARKMDRFDVVFNVLLPLIHLSTKVAFKLALL